MPLRAPIRSVPLWEAIAKPGVDGDLLPEVADARRMLAAHPEVAYAIEAVLARRAFMAAARAAATAGTDVATRANHEYAVIAEILVSLFEPRHRPATSAPETN